MKKEIEENPIKGHNFLVTGKLEEFRREEIKNIIMDKGGYYKSGVTKDLDYLITNELNNKKVEKAKKLGVKRITEQEFKKMLCY